MKRIAIIAALLAGTAGATPYDGLYHPSFGGWSCEREQVGVVGGALSIEGDRINGLAYSCRLSGPTPVRDMDAVLYDEQCEGDWEAPPGRVMLMQSEDGVLMIRNSGVTEWLRC